MIDGSGQRSDDRFGGGGGAGGFSATSEGSKVPELLETQFVIRLQVRDWIRIQNHLPDAGDGWQVHDVIEDRILLQPPLSGMTVSFRPWQWEVVNRAAASAGVDLKGYPA